MTHADPLDAAAEQADLLLQVALQNRPRPQLQYTGKCHYCFDDVFSGHFCGADCSHDYSRREWSRKQRPVS